MGADKPRPLHEWHEGYGDVLWWLWPIEQPPYVGSPLDMGLPIKITTRFELPGDPPGVWREGQPIKRFVCGWPWVDADDDTLARLYWTPLPDCDALDEAIRDDIRGGPDPFKADPA